MKTVFTRLIVAGLAYFFITIQSNSQSLMSGYSMNKPHKEENLSKTIDYKQKQTKEQKENVLQNIVGSLQRISSLHKQGKSDEEIKKILNIKKRYFGTGSVSGKIYESDGITLINKVFLVGLFDEYGQVADYSYSGSTSSYKISNVAAGKYYVLSEERMNYINKFYNNVDNWQDATLVSVTEGNETTGINFSLSCYQGAISGNVKDEDGKPMGYCYVYAISEDDKYGYAETDYNGHYVIEKIPSGQYKVCVRFGLSNYFYQWFDHAAGEQQASIVQVTDGATTSEIDFSLSNMGSVSGEILTSDNTPPDTYHCRLNFYDLNNNLLCGYYLSDSSNYAIKGIPAGSYKIEVEYFEYYGDNNITNIISTWYGNVSNYEDATVLVFNNAETKNNIDINLLKGGIISGTIKQTDGQLLTGQVIVNAYDVKGDTIGTPILSTDGKYSIIKLLPGEYKVKIKSNEYIEKWFNEKDSFENANPIEVAISDSIANIDFQLEKGTSISGNIYNSEGQIITDECKISVFDLQKKFIKDIRAISSYIISGLKPDKYILTCEYWGDENYLDQIYDRKYYTDSADVVSTVLQSAQNVNFIVEHEGRINGYVSDLNGNRLSNKDYIIDLILYDAISGNPINFSNTSFNSGYSMPSFSIVGKICAMSVYSNYIAQQDSFAIGYYGGGTSFNDPKTKTVNIDFNSINKIDDIKLEKVNGSITGSLFYKNNSNRFTDGIYEISAYDESGYIVKGAIYSETNKLLDGKYMLSGLRPGKYYLVCIIKNSLNDSTFVQWYGGINADFSTTNIQPRQQIPEGAIFVEVSDKEIEGKDFYFDLPTKVENKSDLVKVFKLEQNYPNPFNPSTTIQFSIPSKAHIQLKVYNLLGEEVSTLINQELERGNYSITWHAQGVSSGVYFYQLSTGASGKDKKFIDTKKLLLIK